MARKWRPGDLVRHIPTGTPGIVTQADAATLHVTWFPPDAHPWFGAVDPDHVESAP